MTTPDQLNAILAKGDGRPIPRLTCEDGFTVSVQANQYAYASPRSNTGPWYQAEIGFPSEEVKLWAEWIEDPENPTDTVYGYVPLQAICDGLNEHGGIKE